jgi:CHASE3 domain sensor protein
VQQVPPKATQGNGQPGPQATPPLPKRSTFSQPDNALQPEEERGIPGDLYLLENGRVVERIKYLRKNYRKISPDEMHLIINPDEVEAAAGAQFAIGVYRLEGIRNGLVYLPLMVTWLSLGIAGSAYAQSIQVVPSIVAVPFIKQWIDGFTTIKTVLISVGPWHVLLPLVVDKVRVFTFGSTVGLDVILLLCLVLLTFWSHLKEQEAQRRAAKLGAWLRGELFELDKLSPIRSLGDGPENKRPRWAMEVQDAIDNLTKTLAGVQSMVRGFEKVLDGQSKTVTMFMENTKDIGAAIDRLHTIYQHGQESYNVVRDVLPRVHEQFSEMATEEREGTKALKSIAAEISQAAKSINELARPFAAVGTGGLAEMARNTQQQLQATAWEQQQTQRRLEQLGKLVERAAQLTQANAHRPWWRFWR